MWIIVLKSILALISIFTGGAIFYKYIKDNKILVFLAGSVSILSAVYLFNEVGRDIDKLVVEKKVEAKVEEKQDEVIEVKKVESKEEVVLKEKKKSKSSSSSNSKWITSSNSVCKSHGGKVDSDGCRANWENAKEICSASGGSLPRIEVLKGVITDCGGEVTTDRGTIWDTNAANSSYQSCYKEKGFTSGYYWSSTIHASNTNHAWYVLFYGGYTHSYGKSGNNHVRCVRAGQ